MSMDFTAVIATNEQNFVNALLAADDAFEQIGGRRGEVIGRDDIEQTADRDVEDDELPLGEGIMPIRHLIAEWRDATIEYRFQQFTAYLQIVLWRAGFLNAFVHVDLRTVRNMTEKGRLDQYQVSLARLGAALRAKGGIGDVELATEPIKPDMIPELIFARAAPLGLIPIAEMSLDELRRRAATYGSYRIESVSSFYLLLKESYPVG